MESSSYQLNTEQQLVFDECVNGDRSVFCTGEGGTGKSRVIQCVVDYFRNHAEELGIKVAVTASTGVAAFVIRGMTLHRFAGAGIIHNDREVLLNLAARGRSTSYWQGTDILIIDEISMVSHSFFDSMSYVAGQERRSTEPFGGIRVLMFGDFLQLPPVSRNGSMIRRVYESQAWKDLNPKVFNLSTIVRQVDPTFTRVMSNMRMGRCTDEDIDYIKSLSRQVNYDDSIEPVRLYSLKRATEEYNALRLAGLTTTSKTYTSTDSGTESMLSQCPAPRVLKLKEGCQVMLVRNMTNSAVNGSIGTVVGFKYLAESKSFQPVVDFIGQDSVPFTMTVPYVSWENIYPDGSIMSSRRQVPLILAWAITIHKSQGQTIPRLYVDMNGIFECGQAYVALSRCTNPAHLQVENFSRDSIKTDRMSVLYHQSIATNVAGTTQTRWDRPTADTLTMLGQLSIRGTSPHSQ